MKSLDTKTKERKNFNTDKTTVQTLFFLLCFLFTITSSGQTNFALDAPDSGGSGFKTMTNNTDLAVSNVMVDDGGTEMYYETAAGQSNYTVGPFSIKAFGVTSFTFEEMNFNAYTDLFVNAANSSVIFKNASGDVIQTMTLNSNKGMRAGTNTSFSSFFDNGTTVPINNVAEIIVVIYQNSTLSYQQNSSNFTYTSIITSASALNTTPTLTTTTITTFDANTASLGGNVTADGGASVTERGVVYSITSTNSNPEIGGTGVTTDTNGTGTGSFSESISGLTTGTEYSVQAYATNSEGTSYGGLESFTTTMAEPGNALILDGSNDYITTTTPFTSLNGSSTYTISAWIKPDYSSNPTDSWEIVSIADNTGGDNATDYLGFRIHESSKVLQIGIDNGEPWTDLGGNTAIPEGIWSQVAVVVDGTNVSFYFNGIYDGGGNLGSRLLNELDVLTIGATDIVEGFSQTHVLKNYFKGMIDEVRVWNDVRTATEIKTEMDNSLIGDESGLVAFYNFNHLSGTTLTDYSTSNPHNGTLQNMAGDEWTESYALVIPIPNNISSITATSFTMSWNAPETGTVDAYYIDVDDNADFSSPVTAYNNFNAGSNTNEVVNGLTLETTYYTRVRASKSSVGSVGANSDVKSATTLVTVPTAQCSNIVYGYTSDTRVQLHWSNGNGAKRAVFMKQANTGTASPVDETTYSANFAFGSGNQIGTTGWYCIYNGTDSNVVVSNLTSGSDYMIQVFEYNGSAGNELYLSSTASNNPIVSSLSLNHLGWDFTGADWESTDFTIVGDPGCGSTSWPNGSSWDSKRLRLTCAANSKQSSAWLNTRRINPTNDWGISYLGSFSYPSSNPADGLAFHIQPVGTSLNANESYASVNANALTIAVMPYNTNYFRAYVNQDLLGEINIDALQIDGSNEYPFKIDVSYHAGTTTLSVALYQASTGLNVSANYTIDLATELSDDNNYYVGFSARTGAESENHDVLNFDMVANVAPALTTTAVSTYDVSSATIGGNISDNGGATVTERGVVYSVTSTNSNPEIGGTGVTKDTNGTGTGSFSESISGLTPGTNYSVQAYAINSEGTSYGGVESFTTSSATNAPVTQSVNVTYTNVQSNQIDIGWTRGDGDSVAVFMYQGTTGTAQPVDDVFYASDAAFGSGDQIGTSGWYCVYRGTGTSVTVTGFSGSTDYRIHACEFNFGSILYNSNSSTNNPINQATVAACTEPDIPVVTANPTSICPGSNATLSISGNLNDATNWHIYTGSCGGTQIGTTATSSFVVSPSSTTTYYVRGEGGCVTPGSCGTVTVTAEDNTNPTAVCQNINVYLDGSGNASIVATDIDGGSTDNCGLAALSASPSVFTCADIGANNVTLTATDGSGNTDQCTATVTVIDTTSPTAVCQNINVYLDGSGNASIVAADIDGGSTDNCSSVSLGASPTSFTCADIGANNVTLTVTDGSSNTDICTATVTVIDTTSPTAVCQNINVYLDGSGNASIVATDIDGGSTDNCGLAALSASPSVFTCADIGANNVTLTATDGSGNTDQCTATVTVIDTTSPTAVCQNINVYLDGSGNASIVATDIDGGSTDNCGLAALSASPSVFTCTDIGANNVTLTATDGSGNTDQCTATVTVIDTTSPTAVCQNINVYLDGSGNASIVATDIDGGSTDNCGLAALSASPSVFTCADIGANNVTLTATDGSGNTDQCTATVTVIDTTSPTAVCQNINVYLDGSGNASIVAADIDGGSTDNCSSVSLGASPTSFTCADIGANNVTLTVTDGSSNTDQCTATVTVEDTITPFYLGKDTLVYYLEADSCSAGITLSAGQGLAPDLSYSETFVNGTTYCPGSSQYDNWVDIRNQIKPSQVTEIQASSSLSSKVFILNDKTLVNQIARAFKDGNQLSVTAPDGDIWTIGVDCRTGCNIPSDAVGFNINNGSGCSCSSGLEIRPCIGNANWGGGGGATCGAPTQQLNLIFKNEYDISYDDNCSVTRTQISGLNDTDYYPIGTTTNTYRIEDQQGNYIVKDVVVEVIDTISPTASCKDITVYLDASGSATIDSLAINDGSSDNCTIESFSLDVSSFDCSDVGANMVTMTVTDENTNTSTCSATVTVLDTISPTAVCQEITVQLDATGNATIAEDSISNGSADACGGLSFDTDVTDFDPSAIGNNILTLTVTDGNGNSSQCTSTVIVGDFMAPQLKVNPLAIALWETGEYVLKPSDLESLAKGTTDNINSFKELEITASPRTFECIHAGDSISVKITVTDTSGNAASAWTKVMVYDETPPVAVCEDIQVVLDEDGEARILPGMINAGNNGGSNPGWVRTRNDLNEGSYDACGIESASLDKNVFDCSHIGENVVTLTVTDPSDNSSSCEAVVTVVDTLPPQITPVDDITIELPAGTCEAEIDYPELNITDNCETVLEKTAGLGPDTLFPVGTTTETWVATDAAGNTAEVSFTVTVTTGNALPTVDAIEDVVAEEDSPAITIPITGIGYGADCEPQEVVVTATGTNPELMTATLNYSEGETGSVELSFTPELSGTAEVEVMVEDNQGGAVTETFAVTVNAVNDAPYLVNRIPDQMVHASYVLKVPIIKTLGVIFDDNDDDQLNFLVMQENGEAPPAWATMSNDTLIAAPLIADTGCVNIVIMATDAAGASVSDTFSVCVDAYPVSSPELVNTMEVKVYPNPTRGKVNLHINTAQYQEMDVLVTSITGKEVFRETYQNDKNLQIDLSGNVAGIYLVLLNIDGNQFMKKIILDK